MTDFNANKFDKIRKKLKWVPARFRFKDWLYDKVMQVNTHRHLVKIEWEHSGSVEKEGSTEHEENKLKI